MRKKLLLLLIMFMPFFINAEEIKMEKIIKIDKNIISDLNLAIPSKNNEFILAGKLRDANDSRFSSAVIAKIDKDGNLIWNDKHANSRSGYVSIYEFDSGEIITIGNEYNDTNEGVIKKYTIDGNVLWEKNWGGISRDDFNSSTIFNKEEIVVVGFFGSEDIEGLTNKGDDDAVIIKYNVEGDVLWQKAWGGTSHDQFNSVIQTSDGGLTAVGDSSSTDIEDISNKGERDAIIVKYDAEGNALWQNSLGGTARDEFYSVVQTAEGSLVAVGQMTSEDIEGLTNKGYVDAIIVKYDINGNILWKKNWGGSALDQFNNVIQTSDGGLIAIGYSFSNDIENLQNKGERDAIIVKYDKNGNVLWQDSFGGNYDDSYEQILETSNGEIIVVGNSYSTNIEGLLNENGNLPIIVKYSIQYDLENKIVENSKGTATVIQQGSKGIVAPIPDKGYEVDQIIIKDSEGNILDIETTKLEDGTYSFPLYTDVSVEVTFKEKVDNPKTGLLNYGAILSLFMLLPILALVYICRYNQKYGL